MPERPPVMPDLGFGDDDLPEPAPAVAVAGADALAADALAADAAADDAAPAADADTTLEHRRTPAERLFDRIGHRGFSRPRVAVSSRLFQRYRVTDPWDPDPSEPEDPIALGPVSLKLGDRRDPAPHLRPPERKQKAARSGARDPASFRPRGVPSASTSTDARPRPKPKPDPTPKPTPTPPSPPEPDRPFGGVSTRQPLRAPLPQRPDLAAADAGDDATPTPPAPRAMPPVAPPPAAAPQPQGKGAGGRFRMKPTRVSAPVVKEVRRLDQVTAEEAAAPEAEAPAPAPRATMPMGDSLDDLFGMAAMGGRLKMERRKPAAPVADEGEED